MRSWFIHYLKTRGACAKQGITKFEKCAPFHAMQTPDRQILWYWTQIITKFSVKAFKSVICYKS